MKINTVAADIDLTRLRSLGDLLERACTAHADRIAYVQMGAGIKYRELLRLSRSFAAWLHSAGFSKGDRIAIMLPNVLQYPVAMFGALQAGLAVVNTNPLYTAPELRNQLQDSGAVAIVVLENFAAVVGEAIAGTRLKRVIVTAAGDFLPFPKSFLVNSLSRRRRSAASAATGKIPGAVDFRSTLRGGRLPPVEPVRILPDDLAFLQYTGGTTGAPKGAMLTHRNICANVLQCEAWLDHTFDEPDVLLSALPLYHIFALTVNCLVFLRLGWKNVLIANPRDFPRLLAEMRRHRFAFISGVNTLFKALLNTRGFPGLDFSRLRIALAGGMALEPGVAARWRALTGTELTQAWGLTEASPGVCINPRDAQYNGSVGTPISCTEVAVKDGRGTDLEAGHIGEICVRGPQVMAGYWNRPAETAETLLPDGWLRTGDIGRIDEKGFVYIVDRKKDMIVVSGFKVYSNEVEGVALTHPAVLEAAAVAQSDAHSGEAVSLYVVRKDSSLSETDLIEHCRTSLAAYKVPKQVYFRTELPKTILGKISKQALRNQFAPATVNCC